MYAWRKIDHAARAAASSAISAAALRAPIAEISIADEIDSTALALMSPASWRTTGCAAAPSPGEREANVYG